MRYVSVFIAALLLTFSAQALAGRYAIYVLGVAQDGGYPHAGCVRQCCSNAWQQPETRRFVTSLALVDFAQGKWWLFDATPDFTAQLQYLKTLTDGKCSYLPEGIFLTHAHIGHYTGLMQLGREVMDAKKVRVYVLPRMRQFLETNGPWSQLVSLHNIKLIGMTAAAPPYFGIKLADGLAVAAFTVPHRDEYSETAGFRIEMNSEEFFFIPDINKWERWDADIRDIAAHATAVLIDGTFYADGELPGRSISEVPHPFVTETMALFGESAEKKLPPGIASKIWFIHLNHTNPLLWDKHTQEDVRSKGFNIAFQGQKM